MSFDIGTISVPAILEFTVAVAIVGGVILGLIEVRHATSTRRDLAAVDIVRTVQTQEVRRAVERILKLPDDTDPSVIRDDSRLLEAALAVDSACEMWGSLVFERVVDLHMLDRMVGGWVRETWLRLRKWVEAEREDNRNPNVGEWWQWLYERLQEDPDPGKSDAAYVAYRGRVRR